MRRDTGVHLRAWRTPRRPTPGSRAAVTARRGALSGIDPGRCSRPSDTKEKDVLRSEGDRLRRVLVCSPAVKFENGKDDPAHNIYAHVMRGSDLAPLGGAWAHAG